MNQSTPSTAPQQLSPAKVPPRWACSRNHWFVVQVVSYNCWAPARVKPLPSHSEAQMQLHLHPFCMMITAVVCMCGPPRSSGSLASRLWKTPKSKVGVSSTDALSIANRSLFRSKVWQSIDGTHKKEHSNSGSQKPTWSLSRTSPAEIDRSIVVAGCVARCILCRLLAAHSHDCRLVLVISTCY